MGNIVSIQNLPKDDMSGLLKPVIFCCDKKMIPWNIVSLNLRLSQKLIKCRENRRSIKMESFLLDVLSEIPDGSVISEFDVMFNPDYRIDLLKILISVRKKKSFTVLWPGKYEDGKLYYAEYGCSDYKIFNVDEYDVTCVV